MPNKVCQTILISSTREEEGRDPGTPPGGHRVPSDRHRLLDHHRLLGIHRHRRV
jgi:hypothetical protein